MLREEPRRSRKLSFAKGINRKINKSSNNNNEKNPQKTQENNRAMMILF